MGLSLNIPFVKMSGSGNDFIVIDNRPGLLDGWDVPRLVRQLCARRISVGADGMLLVEKALGEAHFRMRYFDADGTESAMCGNGARCLARFAYLSGIAPRSMAFETCAYIVRAMVSDDGTVEIEMGEPQDARLDLDFPLNGKTYRIHYINTGVPHIVCYVEDLASLDVARLGPAMRHHPRFGPDGVNVNFVQDLGRNCLAVRTYETGVEGETLSCGTGATAAGIISYLRGMVAPPVDVRTRGGILKVDFRGEGGRTFSLRLKGDARMIYKGVFTAN
jgi:diaminopimelate epimerase